MSKEIICKKCGKMYYDNGFPEGLICLCSWKEFEIQEAIQQLKDFQT